VKKNILFALAALLLAPALPAQVRKIEFQASGLTCSMCSKAISKALTPLPFVKEIKTDLNKSLFSITLKDSGYANLDDIKTKVEEAGFSVAKLWIEMDFSQQDIKNESHLEKNGYHFNFMNITDRKLNGNTRLQVIDKGFVSAKDFKKFSAATKLKCYKTGYAADCCPVANASTEKTRMFHVTI
jgi:copper chaperone CopZ